MYHHEDTGSNRNDLVRPPRADLRYLAAELERLAQELRRGPIPTTADLVLDQGYWVGRRAGYRMSPRTSGVLAGLIHGLRRVAAHRRAPPSCMSDSDVGQVAIYPCVSSVLEGGEER